MIAIIQAYGSDLQVYGVTDKYLVTLTEFKWFTGSWSNTVFTGVWSDQISHRCVG